MDQAKLKKEAVFSVFNAMGTRLEIAVCSLCMGNQARVPDGINMLSTSTSNFDDRIGNGAQVYLGSAEFGAVTSTMCKLQPPAEYLAVYKEKNARKKAEIYQYLQFDEMGGYKESF
jgi:aconitate hydratase 2/2-methylisocitrate dehydratase